MKKESIDKFEDFLKSFTKKNGKKLSERTIHGLTTLARFIEETTSNESIGNLKQKYQDYSKTRNHAVASYALWLYLKSVGYDEKTIKEVVTFKRRNISAITDEEKLSQSVLSKKELLYLVENIKSTRDQLIVKLLYDTASRISEILNIKLKDTDLKTREIQVMGKGRKPRTVYFHQSTAKMLRSYLEEKKIVNPNIQIFNIKPATVWYNLKKYGKELLSRDLHPHMLRHSRLQHMADEGVDSFAIKSYAGHSDIGTSQIYVKSSKFQGKIASERAGDVWENK